MIYSWLKEIWKDRDKLNEFKLPLSESFEKEKIIIDLKSNLKSLEKRYKRKKKISMC